jgi:hypothetical protein
VRASNTLEVLLGEDRLIKLGLGGRRGLGRLSEVAVFCLDEADMGWRVVGAGCGLTTGCVAVFFARLVSGTQSLRARLKSILPSVCITTAVFPGFLANNAPNI